MGSHDCLRYGRDEGLETLRRCVRVKGPNPTSTHLCEGTNAECLLPYHISSSRVNYSMSGNKEDESGEKHPYSPQMYVNIDLVLHLDEPRIVKQRRDIGSCGGFHRRLLHVGAQAS